MKKDHRPECNISQSFIKTSSKLTGRQLFEKERKEDINATANERRAESSDAGSHAGMYQKVLKEMWDEESDQEDYEKRAEELKGDVQQ
jgi:hypothetical protein